MSIDRIRTAAENLQSALVGYDPGSMRQMVRDLPALGEALSQIGSGVRAIATRSEQQWPTAAAVTDGLYSMAGDLQEAAQTADVAQAFGAHHGADIERHDAPRGGSRAAESRWDVSRADADDGGAGCHRTARSAQEATVATSYRPVRPAESFRPASTTVVAGQDGGLDATLRDLDGTARWERQPGGAAVVHLVTLPDGRQLVHKNLLLAGPCDEDDLAWARRQADAEELTTMVAAAVDAPVAQVSREKTQTPHEVWTEHIPGQRIGADALTDEERIKLGLLDVITGNQDRRMRRRDDGVVCGVDHGDNWLLHSTPDPREPFIRECDAPMSVFVGRAQYRPDDSFYRQAVPVDPDELKAIRNRLESLRGDFDQRGHGDWLDYSLGVVDELTSRANPHSPAETQALPSAQWDYGTREVSPAAAAHLAAAGIDPAVASSTFFAYTYDKIHGGVGGDPTRQAEPVVNAAHRGLVPWTPQSEADAANLDRILTASPLDRDAVLYRGFQSARFLFPDGQLPDDLTGTAWADPAYTSCAADPESAEVYAGSEDDAGFVARLFVPAGTGAAGIGDPGTPEDGPGLDEESEVVLQRGNTYRVVRDHGPQGEYGIRWADVEVRPRPTRDPLNERPDGPWARLYDKEDR